MDLLHDLFAANFASKYDTSASKHAKQQQPRTSRWMMEPEQHWIFGFSWQTWHVFFFFNAPSQIVKLMIHELWWSDIMCNNDNHWLLQDIYCIDMWYVYNINGIWNLMMYLRSPRREWQYYIMSMQGSLKTVWELSGLLPKQLMSFLVLNIFSTINICHYNWYKYH